MANWYIRSGAAGTATGADWTNAKLTLAAALTAGAAGDSFWVSEDHAETQASAMTLTSPGTAASPCFIYCVNHAGSVPPVSADLRTGASISTTGASNMTFGGYAYVFSSAVGGFTFSVGSATNAANLVFSGAGASFFWCFDGALLKFATTSSGSFIQVGVSSAGIDQFLRWKNTQLQFAAVGQAISLRAAQFLWQKSASAIQGATIPTALFASLSNISGLAILEAVDLSALGSGKTIVAALSGDYDIALKDCALGASVTVAATPTILGGTVKVFRGDSAATNYRAEKYHYLGTETVETTIVRTGGASDGTTTIAKKLVTTANSRWVLPFEALPIAIWNDTSGSAVTVTIFGIWGSGAVPNNDDIWFDLEYLGSSSTPQGSFATASKADNLATGSALTSDTSTWGGSTTKFKMSVTVTPQQKGAMYIYLRAAKASTTFYIDPKPVLS